MSRQILFVSEKPLQPKAEASLKILSEIGFEHARVTTFGKIFPEFPFFSRFFVWVEEYFFHPPMSRQILFVNEQPLQPKSRSFAANICLRRKRFCLENAKLGVFSAIDLNMQCYHLRERGGRILFPPSNVATDLVCKREAPSTESRSFAANICLRRKWFCLENAKLGVFSAIDLNMQGLPPSGRFSRISFFPGSLFVTAMQWKRRHQYL
ncbi:hypothetical protein CEXT_798881 [Caerostris extrusa]|uniref:Uncharacterized protein n=1 Tax=Caerostris extrusa TaxID=172846 RepID=A0AAV4UF72_CAEEX|nr:hypothetical protein CEXT_798881 [Caerostris extrusa]